MLYSWRWCMLFVFFLIIFNFYLFFFYHLFPFSFFFNFWFHHSVCGILAANQGSNLFPLHWELRVLTTGLLGKSQGECFLLLLLNASSLHRPWGSKAPSLCVALWPGGPQDEASPPEPPLTLLSPRVMNPPAVWLLERRCLKLPALLAGFWGVL